ncbi:hypothetical protein BMF94_4828, partial [Rhodotorula taiwanensis]
PQRLLVGCEGEHKRLISFPKLYASRPFESPDFREPALAPIPSRSPLSRFLSPRRIIATMPYSGEANGVANGHSAEVEETKYDHSRVQKYF